MTNKQMQLVKVVSALLHFDIKKEKKEDDAQLENI